MASTTSVADLIVKLGAGLEGVTPGFGQWIRLFGERTVYTRDPNDGCRIHAVVRADSPGDNATLDHIARCAPDNIRLLLDHVAKLSECLDCARQDWEGNNGEIIDKSDPHWTVEARRLVSAVKTGDAA
ncbi:MAG: hypothetical protein EOR99_32975 [Mesorhizobium sp.]|nr:MAG: hypothetical protein EOR99_32975 [Mesorhizobium sp.]